MNNLEAIANYAVTTLMIALITLIVFVISSLIVVLYIGIRQMWRDYK